ncbi:MAG TPA: hypothetical protein VI299_02705 [Polyangiales bacterium]
MDTLARRAFKLGAWLFVGIFVGHTIAQLATDLTPQTPARAAVFTAMGTTLGMDGSMHTLLDFQRGDSYAMGFMFLAVGALLLVVARTFDQRGEPYPRAFSGAGFLIALAALLLSVRFFPVPPIIVMSVATIAFGFTYSRS